MVIPMWCQQCFYNCYTSNHVLYWCVNMGLFKQKISTQLNNTFTPCTHLVAVCTYKTGICFSGRLWILAWFKYKLCNASSVHHFLFFPCHLYIYDSCWWLHKTVDHTVLMASSLVHWPVSREKMSIIMQATMSRLYYNKKPFTKHQK